jgi:hypothetical protein
VWILDIVGTWFQVCLVLLDFSLLFALVTRHRLSYVRRVNERFRMHIEIDVAASSLIASLAIIYLDDNTRTAYLSIHRDRRP